MTSTNERDSHFFLAGWNGAWRNVNASEHFQNVSKTAPAAVAVRDALLQSEAALEVATARILKADPDHSISVTSEAKALVAVRAALAATPAAAESDVWPCVNIDVDDAGNVTSAKLYSPGLPAGNHDVYPVRVPYMDEHTEAWKACHSELCKLAPDFMRDSKLNGMDSAVAAIRHLATTPAAAAPVLPEPDKQVKELMVLIGKYGSAVEANSTGNPSNYTLASDESAAYEAIKAKLRALLATVTGKSGSNDSPLLAGVSAPAAQAAPAAQSVANADGRFTKNPVTIDAIKWTGSNLREVIAFTDGPPDTRSIHAGMAWEAYVDLVARDGLKIYTLEGKMLANIGDWIIRGIKGEYYPCKPDIFEATYTSAPQAQADARDAGQEKPPAGR